MWWPLILVGGPFFWLLFAGWVIWLLCLLDAIDSYDYYDRYGYAGARATGVTVLFVALLVIFGNGLTTILPWIGQHWLLILATYLPAGVLTALVKWYFFCHDDKEDFEKAVCAFKREHRLPSPDLPIVVEPSDRVALMEYLLGGRFSSSRWVVKSGPATAPVYTAVWPTWQKNKARITTWMSWWWVVAPWSVLHDFIHRLFQRIMHVMGGWLIAMSNWIHGDVAVNFDVTPVTPPAPAHPDADETT